MKLLFRILITFCLLFATSAKSQITENPFVKTQRSNLVNIRFVLTNALATVVDIDLQDYYLKKASFRAGIKFSSDISIEYTDSLTGEKIYLKAIGIQKWINKKSEYVEASFDTKFTFLDFGNDQVWASLRLLFPPLPNGIKEFSICENPERKGYYWNKIRIENVEYENNIEKTKNLIKDYLAKTNNEFAGEYIGTQTSWKQLVFLKDEEDYVLVITDVFIPGWNYGDICAVLKPTAYSHIFIGTWHISNNEELQVTVTFDRGKMKIEMGDEIYNYIRLKREDENTIDKKNQEQWTGTGFALNNGYVVTNYHVIENARNIQLYGVNENMKKNYDVDVIGVDKVNDLALLKINSNDSVCYLNPPYSLKLEMSEVGENVYALGYPLIDTMGNEIKLTNGIISSKSGFDGDVTSYQVSVPIQPGNSGGPMFDLDGNLVGIISAKHKYAENANYSIKTLYLKNLVESLVSETILPSYNILKGKDLKEQVKLSRKFVYLIRCQ